MTKAKEKLAPAIGATIYFGADALKTGFEKSAELATNVQEFSKDNSEAYLESAMIAGAGFQSINSEIYSYSQKAASDAVEVAKTAATTKSIQDLFALQSRFAKNAFEGYVAHITKVGDLYKSAAKKSLAPFEARAKAVGVLVSETVRA